MIWNDLLREVKEKEQKKNKEKLEAKTAVKKERKVRCLHTYITNREAQCVAAMVKGQTVREIARRLPLSARTVDFYLKNAKRKLGCSRRAEMLIKVAESDFMQNKDFF